MPNYLVELEDGRKFQVEADAPPTREELSQYLADQQSTQSAVPQAKKDLPFLDITDVASSLGQAATSLATTVPASFGQMYEGTMNPWQKGTDSIERQKAMRDVQRQAELSQAEAEASGDASIAGRAIRSGIPSYGFTGAIMPASIVAGGATGLATAAATRNPAAAKRAAMAAGTAASGYAAYRMASAQFLDDARERIDNFFLEKAGRLPNEQEQEEAYQELLPLAREMGMAEALPEAFGNLALAGAGKYIYRILGGKTGVQQLASGALSKVKGLDALKSVGAGVAGTGAELTTEGITEVLQQSPYTKLEEGVMRGVPVESVQTEPFTLERLGEGIERVAEPTLATTLLMGGLGAVGTAGYRRATRKDFEQNDFRDKLIQQSVTARRAMTDKGVTEADKANLTNKAEEAEAALKALNEGRSSDVEKYFNVRFIQPMVNPAISAAQGLNDAPASNPDASQAASAAQAEIEKAKAETERLAAEQAAEAARIAEEQRKAAANAIPKANVPPPPSPIITPDSTIDELQGELILRQNVRKTLDFGDQGNAQIDNDIQTLTQEIQSRSVTPPVVTTPPAVSEATAPAEPPPLPTRQAAAPAVGTATTPKFSEEALATYPVPETPPANITAESLPPIPEGMVRLTHATSGKNVRTILESNKFDFSKQGVVDATTDSFGSNQDLADRLNTSAAGVMGRTKFGDKVIIMDVPVGEHRKMMSFSEDNPGTIPASRIVAVYDSNSRRLFTPESRQTPPPIGDAQPKPLAAAPAISPKPPVSPAVETAPIGGTQPPQGKPVEPPTNAAPKIPLEESLREEPQDRVEVRTPEETGAGDSLLHPARGEEEEEVDLRAGLPRQQPGEKPDVIAWLRDNYSLKPISFVPKDRRRKETAEAEAMGILDELPFPVKRRLFSFDYGEGRNVANIDEIASLAYEANEIPSNDPTVLAQAIIEAFKNRKAGKSLIKEGEQQMETAEQRTLEFEKAIRERTAPLTLIPARDLGVGDFVQIGDDNMRVTFEYDLDGHPTAAVLTGPKFGEQRVDPNKPLKAEKHDETNRVRDTSEFVPPDELEGVTPVPITPREEPTDATKGTVTPRGAATLSALEQPPVEAAPKQQPAEAAAKAPTVSAQPPAAKAPAEEIKDSAEIIDSTSQADLSLYISKGRNYYTLWFRRKGFKRNASTYLTILSTDLEEARAKAEEYLRQIASGEKLSIAFAGAKLAGLQGAKTVALDRGLLTEGELQSMGERDTTPVAERPIGFGQYASTKLQDIIAKDLGYAIWLAEKAKEASIRNYLAEQPEIIEVKQSAVLERERIKAFEEREAERKEGKKIPIATLVRGDDGVITAVEEPIPEPKKPARQKERKAANQIIDIIPPQSSTDNLDDRLKPMMFPSQIDGANATIDSLNKNGVALNSDGAGVGKTRQIIAVADYFAKQGRPVVIISENAALGKPWEGRKTPTLGGSMAKDSDAMGVPLKLLTEPPANGEIAVTTYNRVTVSDVPAGAVIIFDESHWLSNIFGDLSTEGKQDREWRAKFTQIIPSASAIAYYTATPADKPHQLAYLHKVLGFNTPEDYIQESLKNGVIIKKTAYGGTEVRKYDVPYSQSKKKKLYGWLNNLIQQAGREGRVIKREISYEGTDVQFQDTKGTNESKNPWAKKFNEVVSLLSQLQAEGWNLLNPTGAILYAAELAKIGNTINILKRELAAGRKSVVFFSRVNPFKINGRKYFTNAMGEREAGPTEVLGSIPSPLEFLVEELEKEGISFTELHSKSRTTSQKAQREFAGDKDVLLASVESGGTGINLDDTTGERPRTEIFMYYPYRGISTIQAMGRIWRASTVQNDNKPNRFVFITASDIGLDASRSAVLAKKLQLMNATLGGTAVAKLPLSKVSYNKDQLAGIEIADDLDESVVFQERYGVLRPVKVNWSQTRDGQRYWSKASADLLEWYERGGPDRTGADIAVFKSRDSGDWIAISDKPYKPDEFAPEGVNDAQLSVESTPQPAPETQPPAAEAASPVVEPAPVEELAEEPTAAVESPVPEPEAEAQAQQTIEGEEDVEPDIDAAISSSLTDEEKNVAAEELGQPEWNQEAVKSFKQTLADWSVGVKQVSERLAAIFQKVLDSAKAVMVTLGVFIGSGVNTDTGITPFSSAKENIPVYKVADDLMEIERQRIDQAAEPMKVKLERPSAAISDVLGAMRGETVAIEQPPAIRREGEVALTEGRQAPFAKRANFRNVAASSDATLTADWIVSTNDNKGMSFLVADKVNGAVFIFDGEGNLVRKASALFGKTVGDQKPLDPWTERTTPSGRFEAEVEASEEYGQSVSFYEPAGGDAVLAIHKVYLEEPAERRQQRLDSKTPADNRISYGCINVDERIFNRDIAPTFADGGIVYVLPETKAGRKKFAPTSLYDQGLADLKRNKAELKKQEKIAKEEAQKNQEIAQSSLKSLFSLISGEKTNATTGNVTLDDANTAMRQIEEARELPNIYFTNATTREEFLADPANESRFPAVWADLKANPNIEGLFDPTTGTAFVFTDKVAVSNLDRKLAEFFGTTPEVAAVRRVLIHESLHKGLGLLSTLDPSAHTAVMRYLNGLFTPEMLDARVADGYSQYSDWRINPDSKAKLIEEVFTEKISTGKELPKDGLWGEFIAVLKQIWRSITGKRGEPTVQDMKDVMRLITNSLRNEGKQRPDRTVGDDMVRYSYAGEKAIPFEEQSGSTQVATTTGSYRTAAKILEKEGIPDGSILDYGAGLGLGSDALRETFESVDSLEVNPQRWKGLVPPRFTSSEQIDGKYSGIVNLNVLNVVPQNIRDAIVLHIGEILEVGGVAVIGVRKWTDDVNRAKNATPGEEPKSLVINKKQGATFQKGFDGNELVEYLQELLGEGFEVRKASIAANGAIVRKLATAPYSIENIAPLEQRLQPESSDIRRSIPVTHTSESAAISSSAQNAVTEISYTPRDFDVSLAIRRAFDNLTRRAKQTSVTLEMLYNEALKGLGNMTRDEFGRMVQKAYDNNSALLTKGTADFPVFNRDGDRAGSVVLMARRPMASMIPPDAAPAASDNLRNGVDAAFDTENFAKYTGVPIKGRKAQDHISPDAEKIKEAAIQFVSEMIDARVQDGSSSSEAVMEVADTVANGGFGNEYLMGLPERGREPVWNYMLAELESRLRNASLKAAKRGQASTARQLEAKSEYLVDYWYSLGTQQGSNLQSRQAVITNPRYAWMFAEKEAKQRMQKNAEEAVAINAGDPGQLGDQVNRNADETDAEAGVSAGKKFDAVVEANEEAALLREGEAELNEEERGLWNRAKMLLSRLAMFARRKATKAASAAMASLSKSQLDELNAILAMSDEEAAKAEAKDRAELKSVLRQLLGEDKPTDTPVETAKRSKRKRMVKVVEQIIFREGKDVEFRSVSTQDAVADLFNGADEYGKIVEEVGDALLSRVKQARGAGGAQTAIKQLVESIKRTLLGNLPTPKPAPPTNASLGKMLAMTFAQQIREAGLYADAWSKGRTEVRNLLAETGLKGEALENELDSIMPPTPALAYAPNAARRTIALAMEQAGVTREQLTDGRINVAEDAKAKVMEAFDQAAAAVSLSEQGWSKQGKTGRQLAEQALNEAVQQWNTQDSNRVKISRIVAEQSESPVSEAEFADKLKSFNLKPAEITKLFDRAKNMAARRVELSEARAQQLIYALGEQFRQGSKDPDKSAGGDSINRAFRDQVSEPMTLDEFIQRLAKLNVGETVATRLFRTAAKERIDRKSMMIFDMLTGPRAASQMLERIARARRGIEMPLRSPISFVQLLSQKARTVNEYRKKVFDQIMASPDFADATEEQKERLADLFASVWQDQYAKIFAAKQARLEQSLLAKGKDRGAEALKAVRNEILESINLGVFNNDLLVRLMGEKFGIKTSFTEAEKARITELGEALQDDSINKALRNRMGRELVILMAKATNIPIAEILSNWWVSSVLSGLNTVFSIGAAFTNGAYEILGLGPVRAIQKLLDGDMKGAVDNLMASVRGFGRYLKAFPEAFNRAWQYLWSGDVALLESAANDPLARIKTLADINRYESVAEILSKDPNAMKRFIGLYTRFWGRLLAALDAFNVMVTKRGALSIALRQSDLSIEQIRDMEEKVGLDIYKSNIVKTDPYFKGRMPRAGTYESALLNSMAEAQMYASLTKLGANIENADFTASQAAMTLNPTGAGGFIYNALMGINAKSTSLANDFVRYAKARQSGDNKRTTLDELELALAYFVQFAAYQAANILGYRFARFAGNKFNQGVSFLPFIGMLRMYEKNQKQLKGSEAAFVDSIYRNQMIGFVMLAVGQLVIKAIADEPDDEKRGWSWNGGWGNLTPEQIKQKLSAGEKQFTIRIGDRVFNYQNWPVNQMFAAIGSISDMIRFSPKEWTDKDYLDRAISTIVAGTSATMEIPALTQAGEIFGRSFASKDPTEQAMSRVERLAAGWLGGFTPRILKDLDMMADPKMRKYKTIWEKTASHIPIYRRFVGEEYYDILGKQIEKEVYPGSREFMERPSDPAYRILGALNSRNIWLTPANAEYRMVGKGRNRRRLTQEEADAYSLETGKAYKSMILRYGPRALQMSTERARAFLSDKADEVRDRALQKVYRGYRSRTSAQ